jgi:hypothetical protein
MSTAMQFIYGTLVTVAVAVSGYFGTTAAATSARVDNLATQQAATAQKTIDVDSRLTRIENKIDQIISSRKY